MVHTILSIAGGHPGCADIGKLTTDAFNSYTTATASFIEIPDPYQVNPYIKTMEDNGLVFAAATMKLGIIRNIMDQHAAEERLSNVLVTVNYLDDVFMNFIMKEIIHVSKNGEFTAENSKALLDDLNLLIVIAKEKYNLRLANMVIPYNDSNDPQKVIYPPIAIDTAKDAIKEYCIYEVSDYLFPEQPIQATAYYAFALYNRFVNTIAAGLPHMYTLNGDAFINGIFGTTGADAMENFEAAIPEGYRINYNGRSYFDPFRAPEKNMKAAPSIDMDVSSDDIPVNDIPMEDTQPISEPPMEDDDTVVDDLEDK